MAKAKKSEVSKAVANAAAGDGSAAGAELALAQRAAENNAAQAAAAASASVAVVLAADVVAFLRSDGSTTSDLAASLGRFADTLRPCMAAGKDHPGNFPLYTEIWRQWCIGYDAGKLRVDPDNMPPGYKASGAAGDAFLYRLACAQDPKRAQEYGFQVLGGEKPKSRSAEAQRSGKRRELPEGTPESWRKVESAALKARDYKKANEAARNVEKLVKAAARDAEKVTAQRLAEQKAEARELLAVILATGDEKRIRAAIVALGKFAPTAE